MKKTICLTVFISMLFLIGCSSEGAYREVDTKEMSETVKDVVQEVADQTANIVDSEDEHVLLVKNGHPESYPDTTYQEAFERFFSYPTWKYFTGTKKGSDENGDGTPDSAEENVDIVEFTGYCMYEEVEVKALIQFTVDSESGTFTATYLSFNDVPQNNLMLIGLLEAAFEDDSAEEAQTTSTETQQQDSADEEMLQEFIELICSYSDPPSECGEEELKAYFKREFDSWKNGESYSRIQIGQDGHLILTEDTEAFVGQWGDTVSQRCNMNIQYSDGKYYIDINWSSSASENTHWSFVGEYTSEFEGIFYEGSCTEEIYTEEGECQENCIYTDGTGVIAIGTDGKLYWTDYKEQMGNGCVFEKTQ